MEYKSPYTAQVQLVKSTKLKKIKAIILFISIACFGHCVVANNAYVFSEKQKTSVQDTGKIKLVLIMSGSCAFEYNIDRQGKGKLTIGHTSDYANQNFRFTDVTKVINFRLKNKKKISELNQLITKIDSSDAVTGTYNADAWRCLVWVNGLNKIDVYGTQASKNVYSVLLIIETIKKAKASQSRCE